MKNVSDDIKIEFGLDKCQRHYSINTVSGEGISLNNNQVIQDLDQAETCRYLGIDEGKVVQCHRMNVTIRKKYERRIKLVPKTVLNVRNKIEVHVILHSFEVTD